MNWIKKLTRGRKDIGKEENATERGCSERDNVGTRHDTVGEAMGYWMGERRELTRKDPFVLHEFTTAGDAEHALLELPCIHRAEDTANLICTEPLIFGFYQTDEKHWEGVICGNDLTRQLWAQARDSFKKHGGVLKNELEP